jgi:hypothetical protein
MRYIKTFESESWWGGAVDKTEVKLFAESYLAYLMDEGFAVDVNLDRHEDDIDVDLHLTNPDTMWESDTPFLWVDIKDHFIPFMTMFCKKYSFSVLKLYASPGSEVRSFRFGTDNLLRLLSDRFKVEEELREIEINDIRRL